MKSVKTILKQLLTNPILIIVYWIFCYELTSLCRYGRHNNNVYILLLCIVFFTAMIIFTTIRTIKNIGNEPKKLINFKAWTYISIIIIILITGFYGVKIYKSATNYGGKLAWFIERLENERSVKFNHSNIYEHGVEGIFQDINKKYDLPKKLYMTNSFNLKFDSDGTITSFDTFVYGKNSNGKDESYLITYNKNKSKDITLRLNGYAKPSYNDDKLVEPLIETVKAIPLKNAVSKWNESKYGLVYYGKRSWGYNAEGVINIGEDGKEQNYGEANYEIIGYTVSLFVPEKENEIIPVRYNLKNNSDWSKSKVPPKEDDFKEEKQQTANNKEEFYLSKKVGYRLNVEDKALGSTFYSLSKTVNGGAKWEVINRNPFNDRVGSAGAISFIDDKLGFLVINGASGGSGELYRTDNGGISFKKVYYPPYKVKNASSITPFDCPGIPYEKDGVFNMVVGQGSDGDYNWHSRALYQSNDEGETWEFVKEVKK